MPVHTRTLKRFLALALGILCSYIGFWAASKASNASLRSQMLAGDITKNKAMPTTLNMFENSQAVLGGFSTSEHPYAWWTVIILCGLFLGFLLLMTVRWFTTDDW